MNPPSEIAVIRARLPYIDRRALSAAWYAALRAGVGEAGSVVPALHRRDAATVEAAAARAQKATPPRSPARPGEAHQALAERKPARPSPAAGRERSIVAAHDSQAIGESEKAAVRTAVPTHAAAFTVTLGDARVRIIVRGEGKRLALTAVCSSRHADIVRLALAHASLGLRMCGALVDTTLHCEDSAYD